MANKKLNWQAFPIALIVGAVYLVVGFVCGIWHPTWLMFFAIPLYHWSVDIVKNKRVKGLPTFIAVIASVVVFLAIGFALDKWHPTWLVFLAIPITSSLEVFFGGGVKEQVKKAGDSIKKKIMDSDDEVDSDNEIE